MLAMVFMVGRRAKETAGQTAATPESSRPGRMMMTPTRRKTGIGYRHGRLAGTSRTLYRYVARSAVFFASDCGGGGAMLHPFDVEHV